MEIYPQKYSSDQVIDVVPIREISYRTIPEPPKVNKADWTIGRAMIAMCALLATAVVIVGLFYTKPLKSSAVVIDQPKGNQTIEGKTKQIVVPNLVGTNAAAAQQQLLSMGFSRDQILFASIDPNEVVSVPEHWVVKAQSVAYNTNTDDGFTVILNCALSDKTSATKAPTPAQQSGSKQTDPDRIVVMGPTATRTVTVTKPPASSTRASSPLPSNTSSSPSPLPSVTPTPGVPVFSCSMAKYQNYEDIDLMGGFPPELTFSDYDCLLLYDNAPKDMIVTKAERNGVLASPGN